MFPSSSSVVRDDDSVVSYASGTGISDGLRSRSRNTLQASTTSFSVEVQRQQQLRAQTPPMALDPSATPPSPPPASAATAGTAETVTSITVIEEFDGGDGNLEQIPEQDEIDSQLGMDYDEEQDVFIANLEDPETKYSHYMKPKKGVDSFGMGAGSSAGAGAAKTAAGEEPPQEEEEEEGYFTSNHFFFGLVWVIIMAVIIVVAVRATGGGGDDPAPAPAMPSLAPSVMVPTDVNATDDVSTNVTMDGPMLGVLFNAGNNGEPPEAFPLQVCQGDCDADDDCDVGLVCMFRVFNDSPGPPGCEGTPYADTDYCMPGEEEPPATTEEEQDQDEVDEEADETPPTETDPPAVEEEEEDELDTTDPPVGDETDTTDPPVDETDTTDPPVDEEEEDGDEEDETQIPQAEIDLVGNNGEPPVVFPLQVCEGDCDNDEECDEGLVCGQRETDDPVSIFCAGEPAGEFDYCVPLILGEEDAEVEVEDEDEANNTTAPTLEPVPDDTIPPTTPPTESTTTDAPTTAPEADPTEPPTEAPTAAPEEADPTEPPATEAPTTAPEEPDPTDPPTETPTTPPEPDPTDPPTETPTTPPEPDLTDPPTVSPTAVEDEVEPTDPPAEEEVSTVDLITFGLLWDIERSRVPTFAESDAATLVVEQYINDWFASEYTGSSPDLNLFVPTSTDLRGGQTAFSLITGFFSKYRGSSVFRSDGDYVVPSPETLDMSLDMAFMEPHVQDLLDLVATSLPPENIMSTATNIRKVDDPNEAEPTDPPEDEVDTTDPPEDEVEPTDPPEDPDDGEDDEGSLIQGTIDFIGNNGEPADLFPLQVCKGDCDDDDECAEGLICRERDDGDPVSVVCEGTPDGGTDYCVPEVEPEAPATQILGTIEYAGGNGEPPEAFPLQVCQGDCDDDSDCDEGLACLDRDDESDPVSDVCDGTPSGSTDYCVPEDEVRR